MDDLAATNMKSMSTDPVRRPVSTPVEICGDDTDLPIRYQPLLLVVVAAGSGIFVDGWLKINPACSLSICLIGLSAWWLSLHVVSKPRLASWALLVAIVGLGAGWHHANWNWFSPGEIGRFADQPQACCLKLDLSSEPSMAVVESPGFGASEALETETRFETQAVALRDGQAWIPVEGNLQLVVHGDASHLYSGDRVLAFGKLVGLNAPGNPGQFDFRVHQRSQRRLASLHVYDVDQIRAESKPQRSASWLSRLRRALDSTIWKQLPAAQAGLASALLLGNRSQLSRKRRDRFVETGTVHLLAISGLHVGILAASFLLLMRLPRGDRRVSLWLTIAFVVFYAWLVEFRPPATRASILIVLFCGSRLLGERGFSLNLLAAAALVVLALNPTDLFAVGPQLSFLAVATLTLSSHLVFPVQNVDPLDALIARTRAWPVRGLHSLGRTVNQAFLVSGMIWLLALPLVAYRFHLVTPIALLINPILILPISIALYSGLAILVIGRLVGPVVLVAAWCCRNSLCLVEWLVTACHGLNWGHHWTAGPPGWSVGLFYLLAATLALLLRRRWTLKGLLGLFAFWIVLGWWLPGVLHDHDPDVSLTCTFVDVGHGGCTLIELPGGNAWVYDAVHSEPQILRHEISRECFGISRSIRLIPW